MTFPTLFSCCSLVHESCDVSALGQTCSPSFLEFRVGRDDSQRRIEQSMSLVCKRGGSWLIGEKGIGMEKFVSIQLKGFCHRLDVQFTQISS